MGHKSKKSLVRQVQESLQSKLSAGDSKHIDKRNNATGEKIYSYNTFRTYQKHDRGEPYRTFLECYLNLMIEGGTITWRRKLWNVLADVDKSFMKNYTKQLFHLDIETLV